MVGALHSIGESEWNVTLLGAPGMTLTKNRTRLRIGNRMLAHDSYLKPLRGDELLGYVNEREASHA
ncbi:hypothetical protein C7S16_2463 [Burkholderia thailandensis]|uniref:Uncharacterized protein n=1 Tax=Burkholderia thailandensis TaxID=57975 RepID=A0AAW9CSX5_BURTH|nr:hypothetical protein [Burkholderia thailandensis]MDW9254095.1 hypothetical protein [Burkholderia thailandensis]